MSDYPANAKHGSHPESELPAQKADETRTADQTSSEDRHKAEKLAKAGRDIDPNEGAD